MTANYSKMINDVMKIIRITKFSEVHLQKIGYIKQILKLKSIKGKINV